jgi:ATP-dependent Clp protease ATP-binding subunit ClpA
MEAGGSGDVSIHSGHFLIGISVVHPELLKQLGLIIEPGEFRTQIQQWYSPSTPVPTNADLPLSPSLQAALSQAPSIADEGHCAQIRTEHLLLSMFDQPCHAAQFLAERGISRQSLLAVIASADCNKPQTPTASSSKAMQSLLENLH